MNSIREAILMRKAMAIIICDSRTGDAAPKTTEQPRPEDSIYLLPVVKDEIRKYAKRKSLDLVGEIVMELRNDTDVLQLAESALRRIEATKPDELLVGNAHLLNDSGMSAILLPAIAQLGIRVEVLSDQM